MNTPIADFVRGYEKKNMTRLHVPGHKGKNFLGCESFDITEIAGADSLYEADGIIAKSEENATVLFGTARTLYSTEGSSQCIRAMLYLAVTNRKRNGKSVVIATRNAHKSFLYAAALLDLEVVWLYSDENFNSLCSCEVSAKTVKQAIAQLNEPPVAVYITSPDYLGGQLDIREIAKVCHDAGTILAVDNAHGAYLHFLKTSRHPMDLGADICCDSAHKTLPVLTGGAYLQISKHAPEYFAKQAKQAMALFGSTSPSYLTLVSLDLCNQYLANEYEERLEEFACRMDKLRTKLRKNGWKVIETDPLKLTVQMPEQLSGIEMANILRQKDIECEYADERYVVCMMTTENTETDLSRVVEAFAINKKRDIKKQNLTITKCQQKLSIRDAIFAEHEVIAVKNAQGRICGSPTVSCPPAIPIVVSGEMIDQKAIELLEYYGMESIEVVKE